MDASERGTELNFAIIDEASQLAVGTTSFYRVVPEYKRLELGKTWLGAPYRRTRINTGAKYLTLNHAFEIILASRVESNAMQEMSVRNASWSDSAHKHAG
jgi:RimJ/RimL family protein N-acetyltransferase